MKRKFALSILIFALLFGLASQALAEPAGDPEVYLLKDITAPPTSYGYVAFNGMAFFPASDPAHGSELWKSDGTVAGTQLVKDIVSGTDSSEPTCLKSTREALFFIASGSEGRELWKTDGTAAGTVLVKDITAGADSTEFHEWISIIFKDVLYFVANDGAHGFEVWRSDGTAAGTYILKDIGEGIARTPESLYVFGDRLFFAGPQGTTDLEPWISDGTNAGTVMLKDIHPDGEGAPPLEQLPYFELNGWLYFGADDEVHGHELWKTDGTPEGTVMVKDINPGSADSYSSYYDAKFIQYKGKVYFGAQHEEYGEELWVTDGTEAGTMLFMDIFPGMADPMTTNKSKPRLFVVFNELLYFRAADAYNSSELWRTDGTVAGTVQVTDSGETYGLSPDDLIVFNNRMYFTASTDATGEELWSSDGTAAGTVLVADIRPGANRESSEPRKFLPLQNAFLFQATEDGQKFRPWAYGVRVRDLSIRGRVTPVYAYTENTTITYTLTFANAGDVLMTGVVITDVLPNFVTVQQTLSSGALVSNTGAAPYVWEVADLDLGAGGVITLVGELSQDIAPGTSLSSIATISSDLEDTAPQNNTTSSILNPHTVFLSVVLRQ